MCELITVEGAAHIHQNASNLVHLDDVAAAKLEATMKCEEGEEIALISKGVLDVDTNAGHEGVESTALWPDCCLSLQHCLDEV